MILEDELQRILLVGNTNVGEFVTGVVVALLGYEDDTGKFIVEDICPANMPVIMKNPIINFSTPRFQSQNSQLKTL